MTELSKEQKNGTTNTNQTNTPVDTIDAALASLGYVEPNQELESSAVEAR